LGPALLLKLLNADPQLSVHLSSQPQLQRVRSMAAKGCQSLPESILADLRIGRIK
jgi:hypothetical protein